MKARLLLLYIIMCMAGGGELLADVQQECPLVPLQLERLPDLNMPRSGHAIFYAGGELTLTGGHTTNFVPTPTAEYFADGEWHLIPMAYSHDDGFAVTLRSGEVIIGGGHVEPLGIGQTFMVERYNRKTHSFEGFGCLDRRRVLASGTQLADGRVIIAGNHYADDAIACYDGHSQVKHVKNVVQGRSNPYILRTASGDVLIIGGYNQYDKHPDTVWVDRLRGDAFRVPLLEQWRPVYTDQPFDSEACAIGNYSYLLTVTDESGQLGIIVVHGNDQTTTPQNVQTPSFTLLPTACPIPMRSPHGPISYKGPIVVDSLHQRGYVLGVDSLYRPHYVLAVDYALQPAALTLYYSDSIKGGTIAIPIVTPEGDLILAGGIPNDNYKPQSTVWCFHFATAVPTATTAIPAWLWLVTALAAITALAYILLYRHRRKNRPEAEMPVPKEEEEVQAPTGAGTNDQTEANEGDEVLSSDSVTDDAQPTDDKSTELMEEICRIMEAEQLYLQSDLKLQDLAVRINRNSSAVSECINNMRNQSFSQFVNTYRVSHAQKLLRRQPDMKTSIVASASGFNAEASFFRNFKAVTGMTPREWVAQNG